MTRFYKTLGIVFVLIGASGDAAMASSFLLFDDDQNFYGCLNCNPFDGSSICNEFGDYGSEFSGKSIWNEFSKVGSEFQNSSPWSQYGSGLRIVDDEGKYYGRFSANPYTRQRANNQWLDQLIEVQKKLDDLGDVRDLACK